MEKLKKEFNISSPEKFVYTEWRKWDKEVKYLLSAKSNLRGISLEYVIRKDGAPVTIIFDDVAYDVDPKTAISNQRL